MTALVSTAVTEAHQEVDLAVLLMSEAAFLVLGCLVLPAALFSGTRNRGFGFGLMRFGLAASFALSFLFARFFFGITISS